MSANELMPNLHVSDMSFTLEDNQSQRASHSGHIQVAKFAPPCWRIQVSTSWLDENDFRTWTAWLQRRKGAIVPFLTHRLSRPNAKIPVSSDAGLAISGINVSNSTISFSGTGTWTASEGDMISYETAAGGYYLGEVIETKSAASGVMTDLKVHPAPYDPHATTPNVKRINAVGQFVLELPVPSQIERIDERFISFTAKQQIKG